MVVKRKRGQAAAAAALIAVIAGMIIMYIVFLQPDDRAQLLDQDDDFDFGNSRRSSSKRNITILNETPGRIDFLSQQKIEHTIPATHIFTQTQGAVIEEKDSLSVKKTLFSSVESEMVFEIDDLSNTENLLLSFVVQQTKGNLVVTLNGEEIVNKNIRTANPTPITLRQSLLKGSNVLHFRVDSPGIAFWRTNTYTLTNLQITADVTQTTAQRSKSIFLVSPTEKNNLERVTLKFQPDCNRATTGPLDVWINDFNVYSGVPDCGVSRLSLDVPPNYLTEGDNDIAFGIDRGDYTISHIVIQTELKDVGFPVYYFDLSEEEYRAIRNGTKRLVARLDFVEDNERKEGQLIVNGRINGFDTRDLYIEEIISADIERGNNAIKIKPERTLDIRKISVLLVKRDRN